MNFQTIQGKWFEPKSICSSSDVIVRVRVASIFMLLSQLSKQCLHAVWPRSKYGKGYLKSPSRLSWLSWIKRSGYKMVHAKDSCISSTGWTQNSSNPSPSTSSYLFFFVRGESFGYLNNFSGSYMCFLDYDLKFHHVSRVKLSMWQAIIFVQHEAFYS